MTLIMLITQVVEILLRGFQITVGQIPQCRETTFSIIDTCSDTCRLNTNHVIYCCEINWYQAFWLLMLRLNLIHKCLNEKLFCANAPKLCLFLVSKCPLVLFCSKSHL